MSTEKNPIRDYRTQRGKSLEALAQLFNVNRSTILRWETGRVPAERVAVVSAETGIPRHELRPDLYLVENSAA